MDDYRDMDKAKFKQMQERYEKTIEKQYHVTLNLKHKINSLYEYKELWEKNIKTIRKLKKKNKKLKRKLEIYEIYGPNKKLSN